MEILGMTIVLATLVAAAAGVGIRNLLGYLHTPEGEGFDKRKSLASALVGFLVGVPLVAGAFTAAFEDVNKLPEIAQLSIFFIQVVAIGGIDAFTKSGLKARK